MQGIITSIFYQAEDSWQERWSKNEITLWEHEEERLQWFGRVYHREEDIRKVADQDRRSSKARKAKKYDIDRP